MRFNAISNLGCAAYGLLHRAGISRLMRRLRARHVPVIMYHGVCAERVDGILNSEKKHICAEDFERHLKMIKNHCQVIALSRYVESLRSGAPLPPYCAILTFDDGYENNYSVAFPLLKKHAVAATIYVVADFVERGEPLWMDRLAHAFATTRKKRWEDPVSGASYRWETDAQKEAGYRRIKAAMKDLGPRDHAEAMERIMADLDGAGELPPLFAPLKPGQLREMAASGLVEIGSHACRHLLMTTLTSAQARHEAEQSRDRISILTGRRIESFSYPNAAHTPELMVTVERAGYSSAVAEGLRLNAPGASSPYSIFRVALAESDDEAAIDATLCGLRRFLLDAQAVWQGGRH
ncbi:MAG: hypothetical protein A2X40_02385 [Elusimicrobia bacterium GWC2_65_9]|nr:MAG: hypothetical protein A2X40_02385 [Elusimicrobia bacterium GWC2_65_9]